MSRRGKHKRLTSEQVLDLINDRPMSLLCPACSSSEKVNHFTTIWLYEDNATWLVWWCGECGMINYRQRIGAFVAN